MLTERVSWNSTVPADADADAGSSSVEDETMSVTFGLLGEVDAKHRGRPVDLGSPQQRALLGLLLLADNRPVSIEHVVEQMWGPDAERTLRSTVRTYVLRLRRAFADVGMTAPLIETLSSGYRLVTHGATDLATFTHHLTVGRAARDSGDPESAARHLRTALTQWRGAPLAGARAFFVEAERSRLENQRITALEERIALDLRLGRGRELESELLELVEQYPLRERLHESLMLTLYRNGRQADALSAYQQVRTRLTDELGVAPGRGLREMQHRILQGDPKLLPDPRSEEPAEPRRRHTEPPECAPPPAHPRPAHRELPADTPDFTGRDELISRVLAAVTREDTPVAVGLCGLDGSGKTALAVRIAHLARHRYPDGQLYADLDGDEGLDRVAELLGRFLRAMGFAGPLPSGVVERGLLWRSVLTGRRVLLVIDDAACGEQVQLLRPATPGSNAIVTGVRRLDAPALQWENVAALTRPEASALFGKITGSDLCATDPELTASLMDITDGHPQFVRVAGRRVFDRTNWTPGEILGHLRADIDAPTGIHADCRRMRRAVERSMELAGPEISTALRLIAVAQVSRFTAESVAALLGISRMRSLAILHELADVHLLERGADRSFDMLTVVRAYARVHARQEDDPEILRTALDRMRLFYKESERNAKLTRDARRGPTGPAHQTHIWGGVRFTDRSGAQRWLDHNGVDMRMLTDQLLQYSPAHAPVVVSRGRPEISRPTPPAPDRNTYEKSDESFTGLASR